MSDAPRRACCVCGLISAAVMAAGALFGPRATLFANSAYRHSVAGTDSGSHGWLVVGLAAAGAVAFARSLRASNLWRAAFAVVAGGAAVAVVLHDRRDIRHAFTGTHISIVQALQSFVRIGWGLNLALIASLVMTLAALALVLIDRVEAGKPVLSS